MEPYFVSTIPNITQRNRAGEAGRLAEGSLGGHPVDEARPMGGVMETGSLDASVSV